MTIGGGSRGRPGELGYFDTGTFPNNVTTILISETCLQCVGYRPIVLTYRPMSENQELNLNFS